MKLVKLTSVIGPDKESNYEISITDSITEVREIIYIAGDVPFAEVYEIAKKLETSTKLR